MGEGAGWQPSASASVGVFLPKRRQGARGGSKEQAWHAARTPKRVPGYKADVILQGYLFPIPHRALSLAVYLLGTNKWPL